MSTRPIREVLAEAVSTKQWTSEGPKRGPKSKRGSVYRVAKDVGVSASGLTKFLNGEANMSVETLQKLCDYLGLVLVNGTSVEERKRNPRPVRAEQ